MPKPTGLLQSTGIQEYKHTGSWSQKENDDKQGRVNKSWFCSDSWIGWTAHIDYYRVPCSQVEIIIQWKVHVKHDCCGSRKSTMYVFLFTVISKLALAIEEMYYINCQA